MNNKIFKKIISCILTSSILFSLTFISLSAEKISISQKKDFLKGIGYSIFLINNFSDETVERLFSELLGQDVQVETIAFDSFSFGNENINTDAPSLMALSDDVIIELSVVKTFNGNKLKNVRMCTGTLWKKAPAIRNKEAFAINWDSSKFSIVPDSLYTCNQVTHAVKKCSSMTTSINNHSIALSPQGGIGFRTPFITKCEGCKANIKATFNVRSDYFYSEITLLPNYQMIKGSGEKGNINYEYGHNLNPLPFDVGLSLSAGIVSISGALVDQVGKPGICIV